MVVWFIFGVALVVFAIARQVVENRKNNPNQVWSGGTQTVQQVSDDAHMRMHNDAVRMHNDAVRMHDHMMHMHHF